MLSLLKFSALTCFLSFVYSTISAQQCDNLISRNENKRDGILGFQTISLNQPVEFRKTIYQGKTSYMLKLEVLGKSELPNNFSLVLKFENGAKIERNQEELAGHMTKSNIQNDTRKAYMIFVSLSQNDLDLLATNRMTNYKMHGMLFH